MRLRLRLRPPSLRILVRRLFAFVSSAESEASPSNAHATSTAQSSGQTERAGAVFDRYGNSILRYAYSYLHNKPDAEDVLQETLIRYLTKAPAFADNAHERAWLLTVAGNLSKSHLRRNRTHRTDQLSEELVAEQRDDLSFVWDAVKELPTDQRAVIHLFYEEGYPTAQIAQITKRRESTVRSDLTRARAKLKAILGESYDFDEQL